MSSILRVSADREMRQQTVPHNRLSTPTEEQPRIFRQPFKRAPRGSKSVLPAAALAKVEGRCTARIDAGEQLSMLNS